MSRRYKGAILSSTAATTSSSSASGIWTPSQQMQAAAAFQWPGVFPPFSQLTLTLNSASVGVGQRHAPPASVSTYTTDGSVLPTGTIYSSGYFYFTLPPGTYSVVMKGAEGSGTNHGYGATINATLVCTAATRMVAIIGQAGSGSYSGGGMSALGITAGGADTYAGATPVLVAGGGGGGYSTLGAESDAGDTSWPPTQRRNNSGASCAYGGGPYDAGAPFTAGVYTVSTYNCNTGSTAAVPFTSGATGGTQSVCGGGVGSNFLGGFGGGGGGCPGGGGGYYGGTAGSDSPATGGGGGTSYRATSGTVYVSAWSDGALNGSSRSSNPGTAFGYLSITAA